MKPLSKIFIFLTVFTFNLAYACESAYVTFTGEAPEKYEQDKQPLTLYACNNITIEHSMKWGKKNKETIPYGHISKGGKDFFISKYYVASPPLPNSFSPEVPLTLGVLSEDHFILTGEGEKANIFMDYKLLKPIKLGFLPVNYSNGESEITSCIDKKVNTIPINIRCPSFKYTEGDKIGLGKGIAQMARTKKEGRLTAKGQLFLPLDLETNKALKNCTVEIINDIILEHQVYFGTADNHYEKIDLTKAYEDYKNYSKEVNLYCKVRPKNEPATGCNPILSSKKENP